MVQGSGVFGDWAGEFWVLVAVFSLLAWNRYLRHKETMLMLERQSNGLLQSRQRQFFWTGVDMGVVLMALGAALGAGVAAANATGVMSPSLSPLLIGLAVFLFALGAGILLTHALWSRQDRRPAARGGERLERPDELPEPPDQQPERPTESDE